MVGVWSECTAPQPEEEECDAWDNDCDGIVDEGLQRPCQTQCGDGVETCMNGNWANCTASQPIAEQCDSIDNDCDGLVDEDLVYSCQTDCGVGNMGCFEGEMTECSAPEPVPEFCDGLDNDCDGTPDNGDLCESGLACICGSCAKAAISGECFNGAEPMCGYCAVDNCPPGTWCSDCQCVPGEPPEGHDSGTSDQDASGGADASDQPGNMSDTSGSDPSDYSNGGNPNGGTPGSNSETGTDSSLNTNAGDSSGCGCSMDARQPLNNTIPTVLMFLMVVGFFVVLRRKVD